jgi:epidermal growth factor receptor substrate 15
MHLLTSYKSGALRGIPATLPPGLYDAAARRGSAPARASFGARPEVPPVPAIPKQFTGPHRTTSPLNPASRQPFGGSISAQITGGDWLVTPPEKAQFDSIFETVDTAKLGLITGDQAVSFFMKAQLPEEILAQIWDLADIDADGQLSKDEFAVAMYLVRLQRSGKEQLPQVVPPALIPPSMRRQAPAPMAAPTPPPVPAPAVRTAADDLFGLDSPAPPFAQPQMPQSTGGSNSAWHTPASPSRASPQTSSNTFKPFMPTSTFGQSLQPQVTGASAGTPTAARSPPPPSDDLLGDNDPEESNKLTHETTELANLSNQIGSLAKEMHTVQEKRTSAEQNITQTSQQKRDFEARLAQARSMYEQEVTNFKALEERLKTSKAETAKLSQQYALLEGSRQDLQNQYAQISSALAADEQENMSLKEKIRQANAEVAQLKPALEKARSGARQQKGLVAINKKQLATVEGEREKIQGEIDGIATETPQYSEDGSQTPAGSVREVTSPAASTTSQNTNPFFRRTGSSNEQPRSPDVANDQQRAFDSLFGQSFAGGSAAGPPPTSFRSESPQVAVTSPPISAVPTPSVSPPPGSLPGAFPSGPLSEPPAPSQSRQMTPNFLQFNDTQSVTSSTMVSPPASRFGGPDTSGFGTPSQGASDYGAPSVTESSDYSRAPTSTVEGTPARSPFEEEGLDASTKFPEVPAVIAQQPETATSPTAPESQSENKDLSFDELFGSKAHKRSESQQGNDFEEAFASMKPSAGAEKTNGAASAGPSEFPPIQELHHDDEEEDDSSDDERAMGFDDNFTPPAPNDAKEVQPDSIDVAQLAAFPVPGNNAKPPSPDAQQSPPGYETPNEDNSHLPPQFDGLLPERADPTVAPDAPHSVEHATGAPVVSNETQRDSISEIGLPAGGAKVGGPDFEAAFAGMNLAPAAEADDDDDEPESHEAKDTNDFNFSFDSPSQKQQPLSATSTGQGNSSEFFSFDSNVQPAAAQGVGYPTEGGSKPAAHEWDALFAPLDNPQPATGEESTDERSKQPGWALNNDSGEDDLILQRLTGMGFTRDESLDALEKYDYNLDKASFFHIL